MRDTWVQAMHYRAEASEGYAFEKPQPVSMTMPTFRMTLADGVAVFEMLGHFATVEEARRHLEDEFLHDWEIDMALKNGAAPLRFSFWKADVQNRGALGDEAGTIHLQAIGIPSTATLGKPTLQRGPSTQTQYPDPPGSFKASPDVMTMLARFQGYQQGREPLPAMAYFCFTVLTEWRANSDQEAAKQLHVSRKVLSKLSRLSSARGDRHTARKMLQSTAPLSRAEEAWIVDVIKALIRRVGEVDFDPSQPFPEITLSDFHDA